MPFPGLRCPERYDISRRLLRRHHVLTHLLLRYAGTDTAYGATRRRPNTTAHAHPLHPRAPQNGRGFSGTEAGYGATRRMGSGSSSRSGGGVGDSQVP
eukprot:958170-Rhodomonas_salina.2